MNKQAPPKIVWPADHVERRPIDGLIPYARNARMHSDAQIAQIAASMREWGWTNPVLVDEEGGIIAGHGRVLAARILKITEVPVMVARGWTEAQKRAYVIADNQLALNATWDVDLLSTELQGLLADGFDVDLIGFDDIDALLARGAGKTDPDEAPEAPANPVARSGDVWLLGRHRLACGDSTKADVVAAALGGVEPLLMVTDPPYGVEYDAKWRKTQHLSQEGAYGKVTNDDRADWREAWALFPGEVAYVWHGGLHAGEVAESLEAHGFEIRSQIIWAKSSLVIGRGDYHWQHEPCWYAVRKKGKGHWAGDRKQSTIWQIDKQVKNETGHSTQKPVECMRRPILNNSNSGQAVYEPFAGSFTTGIACEMTGRMCLAIELEPAYVDVGVIRWQDFCGGTATLESTGQSFYDVANARIPSVPAESA